MDFKGKVAIVTGGGQGIGEGICLNFAKFGADVAIFDTNLETSEAVAKKLKDMGVKSFAIKTDVTNQDNVNQSVQSVIKEFGTVDILVNNAGYVMPAQSWFKDEKADYWDKVIDVCYKGTIYCSKAVLDTMMEKKYGKICSIASDAARVGQRGQAVYSGAKGAVIAFSKALAQEVAYYKINVNCVCPGATRTPGMDTMPKEMQEKIAKSYLFKRVAEPLDIANAVCFLCSEYSVYMTGQTLSVSSGYTMI
ncbi:MAG: SDR family oxidoreductase [Deltaproteobacteria bacterium]|nr:SDR family oxidoreductase [Deltaproteobacteria bacterium]